MKLRKVHLEFWRAKKATPKWTRLLKKTAWSPPLSPNINECVNAHAYDKPWAVGSKGAHEAGNICSLLRYKRARREPLATYLRHLAVPHATSSKRYCAYALKWANRIENPKRTSMPPPKVEIKVSERREHGVEIREDLTPEGMVDVLVFDPRDLGGSWDIKGREEQRVIARVLKDAGIASIALTTGRRNAAALGTGRGGMVRFGDDMMPGIYRVAVARAEQAAALEAIAAFRGRVKAWLDSARIDGNPTLPMPPELRA